MTLCPIFIEDKCYI